MHELPEDDSLDPTDDKLDDLDEDLALTDDEIVDAALSYTLINQGGDPTKWRWSYENGEGRQVKFMTRTEVREALQWLILNKPSPTNGTTPWDRIMDTLKNTKDGHSFDDWITAFTVRLLDPNCK